MRYKGTFTFLCLAVLLFLFLTSCVNTKKIVYFNNIQDTLLQNASTPVESVIQKNDLLSITVSSLNPQASYIFNMPSQGGSMPMASTSSGSASVTSMPGGGASAGSQVVGYLVNEEGSISFPILGSIKAAGLTKRQLELQIGATLLDKQLLVDPIVNVRFLNFRVTVLGEVARPTTINVLNERISILEALGLAGDLTIYGKRENVLLIREEQNRKIIRRLDLNSEKILTSPFYYLKTNDILYVEPNTAKIASTNRTQQLLPVILSGLSFVAVILSYSILKHN